MERVWAEGLGGCQIHLYLSTLAPKLSVLNCALGRGPLQLPPEQRFTNVRWCLSPQMAGPPPRFLTQHD